MKYMISVREVNSGVVTVNTDCPETAEELAMQEYNNGNVYWDKCECEIVGVERQKSKDIAR